MTTIYNDLKILPTEPDYYQKRIDTSKIQNETIRIFV